MKTLLCELEVSEGKVINLQFKVEKFFTSNMMYEFYSPKNTSTVRVVLNESVRAMKSNITEQLKPQVEKVLSEIDADNVKAYMIEAELASGNWLTKNKKLKKIDITNMWKIIEDAIRDALGVDDSKCIKSILSKECNYDTDINTVNIAVTLFK